jgi:sugar phosphate permease
MNAADIIAGALVTVVLGIALLNPGGWLVAGILATVILAVRYGGKFWSKLYIAQHKGAKGRAKKKKKADSTTSTNDSGGQGQGGRR